MSAALGIEYSDLEELSSDKQRIFVLSYLTSWNATKAAIEAGYSEDSARTMGSLLLANSDIKILLEQAKSQIAEHFGKSKEGMVKFLLDVLTFDISEVVDISPEGIMTVNPAMYKKYGRFFTSVTMTKRGIQVKVYSKESAMEQLAKHTGFYEEDNKQKGLLNTLVQFQIPDNNRGGGPEGEIQDITHEEIGAQKPSEGSGQGEDSKTLEGGTERATF